MSLINNTPTQVGMKFIKRDKWIIISLFVSIFLIIALVGYIWPGEGEFSGLEELFDNPAYKLLLGPILSLSTLRGFLAIEWFSWSWMIAIPISVYFAIRVFLLDVSRSTADFLYIAPITRREVVLGRYIAACVELLVFPFAAFIAMYSSFLLQSEEVPLVELLGAVLIDYIFIILVLSATLFLSLILMDVGRTVIVVGAFYFASYFGDTIGAVVVDFQFLSDFSVFHFRPIMDIFVNSATEKILPNFAILSLAVVIFFALSMYLVEKVEIIN